MSSFSRKKSAHDHRDPRGLQLCRHKRGGRVGAATYPIIGWWVAASVSDATSIGSCIGRCWVLTTRVAAQDLCDKRPLVHPHDRPGFQPLLVRRRRRRRRRRHWHRQKASGLHLTGTTSSGCLKHFNQSNQLYFNQLSISFQSAFNQQLSISFQSTFQQLRVLEYLAEIGNSPFPI